MLASYDSENGFGGLFSSIAKLKEVPKVTDEVTGALNKLQPGMIVTTTDVTGLAKAYGTADENYINFLSNLKSGSIQLKEGQTYFQAYQSYLKTLGGGFDFATLKAKALSVSMKALSSIGWMVAITAVTEVIGFITTSLYDMANASKIAEENAKEFTDSLTELRNSQSSNAETINNLNDEYKELSKGVDNLGNNISLTTEQYNKYHEITNKVADIMPDLVQGWDSEGNAILKVKGNLADLSAEYKKIRQNEAIEAYNNEDKNNYDDVGSTFENKSIASNYFDYSYSGTNPLYNFSQKSGSTNQVLAEMSKIFDGSMSYEDYKTKLDSLLDKNSYTEAESAFLMAVNILADQTGNMAIQSAEEFSEFQKDVKDIYSRVYNDINTATSQISVGALGYAQTTDAYWNSDYQTQINSLLNNLPSDFIVQNNLQDETSMKDFVNNLISDINSNKDGVQKALNQLFSIDINNTDLNPVELKEQIFNSIKTLLDALHVKYDDNTIEEFSNKLGFNGVNITAAKYESVLKKNKEKYGTDFSDFFEKHSINTDDEIDRWLSITEKINDATQAEKAYLEAEPVESPLSFSKAWKRLQNGTGVFAENDAVKSTYDDLIKLAETGKLTLDTFNSTTGSDTFLSQISDTAEEAVEKINKLTDSTKQLSSLKSAIGSIQNAYADKRDNGVAGADTLSSMESEFGSLDYWNKYKQILGSNTSSLDACREAQNKLASEYINSANFLSQLTEKNQDYYTSQLKDLGISNAEAVVKAQLEAKAKQLDLAYSALSEEQQKTITSSKDLSSASAETLIALLGEANGSLTAKNALAELAFETVNWTDLDTSQTTQQLLNIASAAGVASSNLAMLQDINSGKGVSGSAADNARINGASNVQKYYNNKSKEDIQNALKNNTANAKVDLSDIQVSLPSSSSSGSSSGDSSSSSSSQEFDWIEILLENKSKATQKISDKIDDYQKQATKNNLYKKLQKALSDEIKANEKAANYYLKKANKVKISDTLKKKIRNGAIDISTLKGKTAERAEKYQTFYEKATSSKETVSDLKLQKREETRNALDSKIENKSNYLDSLQSIAEDLEGEIDLLETRGFEADESYYKKLNSNAEKQKKNLTEQNKLLQNYLDTNKIKKYSNEWYEIKQQIEDNNQAIQDLTNSQAEWNNAIRQMPLNIIQSMVDLLNSAKSSFESLLGLKEQLNGFTSASDIEKQISLEKENMLYQSSLMKELSKGDLNAALTNEGLNNTQKQQYVKYLEQLAKGDISEKRFFELINKLGISQKGYNNNTLLKESTESMLDYYSSFLDSAKEIDQYAESYIDIQIDKLQEERDLLDEINEAKSEAIELEKKQQALQAAKQNKTNLIYHEGIGYNYEADNSAVNDAQNDLDDYNFELNKEQFDKAIDVLEEIRDKQSYVSLDENGNVLIPDWDTWLEEIVNTLNAKNFTFNFVQDSDGNITTVPKYAKGTKSAKGGMSLVGENGVELRLLNQGDSILPNDVTENLWKFGLDPQQMIMDNLNIQLPDYSNLIQPRNIENSKVVNIENVTLPNINDLSKAQDLFDGLMTINSDAVQRAWKR